MRAPSKYNKARTAEEAGLSPRDQEKDQKTKGQVNIDEEQREDLERFLKEEEQEESEEEEKDQEESEEEQEELEEEAFKRKIENLLRVNSVNDDQDDGDESEEDDQIDIHEVLQNIEMVIEVVLKKIKEGSGEPEEEINLDEEEAVIDLLSRIIDKTNQNVTAQNKIGSLSKILTEQYDSFPRECDLFIEAFVKFYFKDKDFDHIIDEYVKLEDVHPAFFKAALKHDAPDSWLDFNRQFIEYYEDRYNNLLDEKKDSPDEIDDSPDEIDDSPDEIDDSPDEIDDSLGDFEYKMLLECASTWLENKKKNGEEITLSELANIFCSCSFCNSKIFSKEAIQEIILDAYEKGLLLEFDDSQVIDFIKSLVFEKNSESEDVSTGDRNHSIYFPDTASKNDLALCYIPCFEVLFCMADIQLINYKCILDALESIIAEMSGQNSQDELATENLKSFQDLLEIGRSREVEFLREKNEELEEENEELKGKNEELKGKNEELEEKLKRLRELLGENEPEQPQQAQNPVPARSPAPLPQQALQQLQPKSQQRGTGGGGPGNQ